MENRSLKLDKVMKISVMVGAIIVAVSVAYFLIIFLPKKEETKIEQQNKVAKPQTLQEKADSYRDMIKLQNNKAETLKNQISLTNLRLSEGNLSEQDGLSSLNQYKSLLEKTRREEAKYQALLNKIEQQKLALLGKESSATDGSNSDGIDKYGGEVLQTGGIGSRTTQKTAYLLTEQGFLNPAEDWVFSSFNTPVDLMWVNCRDGYIIISCTSDDKKNEIDDTFGCGVLIKDEIHNKVNIECLNKNKF